MNALQIFNEVAEQEGWKKQRDEAEKQVREFLAGWPEPDAIKWGNPRSERIASLMFDVGEPDSDAKGVAFFLEAGKLYCGYIHDHNDNRPGHHPGGTLAEQFRNAIEDLDIRLPFSAK